MKTFFFLPALLFTLGAGAQSSDTIAVGSNRGDRDDKEVSVIYDDESKTVTRTYKWGDKKEKTLFGDLDLSGLWGGPTYNYSSTGDDWALVRGGFGGFEFEDNLFIGYGGWASRDKFTTNDVPANVDDKAEYKFRHGGLILAFSPSSNNTFHPRLTAILGPGRIEGSAPDPTNADKLLDFKDRMFVGQIMAGGELNIFQWFRLGIEGGYRFAGGVDVAGVTANDVSGAIVQVEARFGLSW